MQQFLKPMAGTAGAWIVATELLGQFLVPVHYSIAALNAGFGRESLLTPIRLKSTTRTTV